MARFKRMALAERSVPPLRRRLPARGRRANDERNWQMPSVATLRAMSAVCAVGLRNCNLELVERRAILALRFLLTALQRLAAFRSADRMSAVGVDGEGR